MNIYFDFDYTLVALDGTLRPLVPEVLGRLCEDHHRIYIWSGAGIRTEEARKHDLLRFVEDVLPKPVENFEAGLEELGITVRPDAVVDDHEEIVRHFGGVAIRPYFWPDLSDREMERVYEELTKLANETGPPQ